MQSLQWPRMQAMRTFLSNCVNIVVKITIDWAVTSVKTRQKITIFEIQSSFVAQHASTRFRIHIFCFCHSSHHFSTKIIVLRLFPIFYANIIFLNHADQNRQRINHFDFSESSERRERLYRSRGRRDGYQINETEK